MYGTVMTCRLRGSIEDVVQEMKAWEAERHAPGYVDSHVLIADDGRTMVQMVRFTDKAAYEALADDAEQAKWYEEHVEPLIEGEATWTDGTWIGW